MASPESSSEHNEEIAEFDSDAVVDPTELGGHKRFMRQVAAQGIPTPEEQAQLATRAQAGDPNALWEMIVRNLQLAEKLSKPFQNRGVSRSDLLQNAALKGLKRAVEKFDPKRGLKFSTYATWWLRQANQKAITETGHSVRFPQNVREDLMQIVGVEGELTQTFKREPTIAELVEHTGLDEEQVRLALIFRGFSDSLNEEAYRDNADGPTAVELVVNEDDENRALEITDQNFKLKKLAKAIGTLTKEEQLVVVYFHGLFGYEQLNKTQISSKAGMSTEKVRKILGSAEEKLSQIPGLQAAWSDTE